MTSRTFTAGRLSSDSSLRFSTIPASATTDTGSAADAADAGGAGAATALTVRSAPFTFTAHPSVVEALALWRAGRRIELRMLLERMELAFGAEHSRTPGLSALRLPAAWLEPRLLGDLSTGNQKSAISKHQSAISNEPRLLGDLSTGTAGSIPPSMPPPPPAQDSSPVVSVETKHVCLEATEAT